MSMKKLQEAAKKAADERKKSGLASEEKKPPATPEPGRGSPVSPKDAKDNAQPNGKDQDVAKPKKKKKTKKTKEGADGEKEKKKTKKKKKKVKGEDGKKPKKTKKTGGSKRPKKPKEPSPEPAKDDPKNEPQKGAEKSPKEEVVGDIGKKLFQEVCDENEKGVASLVQKGIGPDLLNALHPFEREKGKQVGVTALHVACEKRNWKIVECLAFTARADVNARDSEDNSVLLWAVKNGADKSIVARMIEKVDADVFLANKAGQTVFFFAQGEVLIFLCEILKGLYPTLINLLGGDDEVGKRYAVATTYSISFKNQRNALLTVPDELWEKLVHLIRFDPAGNTPCAPVDILLPVLIALHNFAIEEKYALAIARQGGGGASFAFLFGLMCKHNSPTVQSYAADALFALTRFGPNKDVIAQRWFKILVKLLSNPNPLLQKKSCRIMAEVSVDHAKGIEQLSKELGAGRLVGLLKSHAHLTNEVCRMLANYTQGSREAQVEVLGESGFAPLVHAAVVGADGETTISALTAIGNLLQGSKGQFTDDIAGAIEKQNLFENLVEAAQEPGALQQVVQRVLELVAASDSIAKVLRQQKGTVAALKKLAHADNADIKRSVANILGE